MTHCMTHHLLTTALCVSLLPHLSAFAGPAPATQPAAMEVLFTLRSGDRLGGRLVSHDESGAIVCRPDGQNAAITWADVTPTSAYQFRRRVMDLTQAESHWQLGLFLLSHNLKEQAAREFTEAAVMDPAYRQRVSAALKEPAKHIQPAAVTAAPAAPAHGEPSASQPTEVIKYQKATPAQAAVARLQAGQWFEQAKTFSPTMHLIETDHFLIYSAWDASSDRGLIDACEGMYRALCNQFNIPAGENIWVGKCPIYVFWEREQYQRFTVEVDHAGQVDAGGYQTQNGRGFCYIVLINRQNVTSFYATLVHEGTHAFLGRYQSNRFIPVWLNEGLAEYMAATVVPNSSGQRLYVDSTREAVRENTDIRYIFGQWRADSFTYGVAQSLTRFLIARDKQAYVKLIGLIKEGKTDDDALQEAYNLTKEELVRQWAEASRRAL